MSSIENVLSCRLILAVMLISGFMFQYMLRTNISIAIVDMIAKNDTNDSSQIVTQRFPWKEDEKNEILGAFFWGYLCTTILGGRLSEIYGTRIVYGTAMLLGSILTLLTPGASYLQYYCLMTIRILMGCSLGVTMPSLPPMAAKWVPPSDRAKFMAHSAATSLGTALTFPFCGLIIAHIGWPSVFYITGSIGLAWTIAWFYFIYDSPQHHPRITKKEKNELESKIPHIDTNSRKKHTPWLKIITSVPVWAIIIANTCAVFNLFLVFTQLPSYMNLVLHFKIQENGFLSSFPFVASYLAAVASSYVADVWIKSEKFSVINVRRILACVLFGGQAILFLLESIWGDNRIISIVVFTLSLGCLGCFVPSIYSNSLDIAPNYAGTIFGIANTTGGFSGYLCTKIVAIITKEKQDFQQWQYIFWIMTAVSLTGLTVFLSLGSASIQSWSVEAKEPEAEKMNHLQDEEM